MRAPDWLTARPVAHRGLHDAARTIVQAAMGDRPRGQPVWRAHGTVPL